MSAVRLTVGKLLAATLLTLCVGLQVLEATGRWDRTFQDTGDEAVIVSVVLCIGIGVAIAGTTRHRVPLSAIASPIMLVCLAPQPLFASPTTCSTFCDSPPLSLRI